MYEQPLHSKHWLTLHGTGDHAFCAVIAAAIALDIPALEAQALFEKHGRTFGKGTEWGITCDVLESNGKTLHEMRKHRCTKCKTMRTLEREIPQRGTFLVWLRNHLCVIKDGVTHDFAEGGLQRVEAIFRVDDE